MHKFNKYEVEKVPNKSKTYILPIVDSKLRLEFNYLIKSTYLSYDGDDEYFCILYEWKSDPAFIKFEGRIMNHPMYAGHVDYGKMVLFKFETTIAIKHSIKMLLRGEVHEIRDEHKDFIVAYLKKTGKTNISRIVNILDPKGELKSSAPEMENETASKCITVTNLVQNLNKEELF